MKKATMYAGLFVIGWVIYKRLKNKGQEQG